MEKSYVKSPVRSGSGSIENLDSYASFLTPHLKIDFSTVSIDTYRVLMKLLRSKNEFTVTCYDVVNDKDVTHKMYFSTEQMPKLWSIAKALNGDEWIELLGVEDFTVELIGTNTNFEKVTVTYNLNKPKNASWYGDETASESIATNHTLTVGITMKDYKQEPHDVKTITFDNEYRFKYWCDSADGTGFKYVDGNEYMFYTNTTLYAIWEAGATN
jgi:hypothetical protein